MEARCLYCGRERNADGVCRACGAESPSVPCRRCGTPVTAPNERCAHCGQQCLAWVDASAHELRCPRCGGRLERADVDGVHVEQCARCLGCFVRTTDFGELVSREEHGHHVDLRVAREGGALPRQALLAPVRCPHCPREMDRARFAQRAELVVDVCNAHGIWLDAGELAAVLAFVKDRADGHATPSAIEIDEQLRWDRVARMRAEEARVVDAHASAAELAGQASSNAAVVVAATVVAGPWAGLLFALRGMHKKRA